MSDELTRTIDEIITLYRLEPLLRDIYVEGITDQLVFQNFIDQNDIFDTKVLNVHEVDFKTIYDQFPDIKSNNKRKLITLNSILESNFNNSLCSVTIIVDKDYDELTGAVSSGNYIKYTDYLGLESYLFDNKIIDTFYKQFLHGFPINGKETIEKFSPILKEKSLIRLTIHNFEIAGEKFTPFERTIKINKKNYSIDFGPEMHIQKILNNIKQMAELKSTLKAYNELKKEMASIDSLQLIRGKDFINLFFQFVNYIKNNIGFTIDTLTRSLFMCIDYNQLKKKPLFTFLLSRYS